MKKPLAQLRPLRHPIVQVMVETDFYKALRVLQDEYYRWIRGSINRWMDKSAWNYLESKIELREQTYKIKLEERADPDKRIPWHWIENVILDEICTLTLGEYFFRPLLAVARNDDEPRLNWCNRIQSCQTAIEE